MSCSVCSGATEVTFVERAVAVAVLLSGKAEVPGTEGPSQEDRDEGDRIVSFLPWIVLLPVSGGIWEN